MKKNDYCMVKPLSGEEHVLVTLGIVYGKGGLLVAGLLLCAASIFIFRKMQQQLREKSWLMLEAIRNRDYSYRVS